METDLLAWARMVVRDLYQFGRLRMQTSMFLCTLDPKEIRDIQIYFYPLWEETDSRSRYPLFPVLKDEASTGTVLVRQLEALASEPSQMELLSAGVGFVDDLRWEGRGMERMGKILRAASLGGSVIIVDHLQYREYFTNPKQVAAWATVGGHLELLQSAFEEQSGMDLNPLIELAAKYDRLPVLKWLTSQGDIYPYSISQCMKYCCQNRNPIMLRFLIDRYPASSEIYRILLMVVFDVPQQNLELIQLVLDNIPDPDLDWLLRLAAQNQGIEVLELLLERGAATGLDDALLAAARSNTGQVASFLMDRGASSYKDAFFYALSRGRRDIAWMLLRPGMDLDRLLGAAARAGDVEVIQILANRGARNFNSALLEGIEKPRAVELLLELGANNFDEGLLAATEMNQLEVSNMLIDRGANNLNEALLYLLTFKDESSHSLSNAQLLVERGARNLNQALLEEIEIMSKVRGTPRWTMARRLVELGASNLDQALDMALEIISLERNQRVLVKMLVEAGANGGLMPNEMEDEY